jgi:hypothetical protein
MIKVLFKFDSQWQAQIVAEILKNEGIESHELRGAREYTSIVTGIGEPEVEVLVDEEDFAKAQTLLLAYFQRSKISLVENEPATTESKRTPKYFRRVMFLSLASMVLLPVVLNIFAAFNLGPMFENETSKTKKAVALMMFCLSLVVSVLESYWIATEVLIQWL